jgi:hypothetical protein
VPGTGDLARVAGGDQPHVTENATVGALEVDVIPLGQPNQGELRVNPASR